MMPVPRLAALGVAGALALSGCGFGIETKANEPDPVLPDATRTPAAAVTTEPGARKRPETVVRVVVPSSWPPADARGELPTLSVSDGRNNELVSSRLPHKVTFVRIPGDGEYAFYAQAVSDTDPACAYTLSAGLRAVVDGATVELARSGEVCE